MTDSEDPLPRYHTGSTVAILALSVASSFLGLLRANHYVDSQALLLRTRVEDVVILAVAVPVLAIGLWYARAGSLRGRVVWLGALAYMTYLWLSRASLLAFNDFFLGYVALFALSLFTLVGGTATTDAAGIRLRLEGRLSRRLYAGILALTAIGLAALWLPDIVPATLSGTTPLAIQEFGPKGALTFVYDLGLLVPSFVLAGYLLVRGQEWGYVTTGVLLVLGALVAPTLSAITIVDLQQGVSMTPGMVVGTVLPPLIPGLFALRFLQILGRRHPEVESPDRRAGA